MPSFISLKRTEVDVVVDVITHLNVREMDMENFVVDQPLGVVGIDIDLVAMLELRSSFIIVMFMVYYSHPVMGFPFRSFPTG